MEITVHQLHEKMKQGKPVVLIDVREPYEHAEFNIGGLLIPLGAFQMAIPDLEDHKDSEIVIYCRSGRRSGIAMELMYQSGFKDVRNLSGGMLAWQELIG